MPLIVLPKSCSCRCGPCPPPPSLVWVCLSSFFLLDLTSQVFFLAHFLRRPRQPGRSSPRGEASPARERGSSSVRSVNQCQERPFPSGFGTMKGRALVHAANGCWLGGRLSFFCLCSVLMRRLWRWQRGSGRGRQRRSPGFFPHHTAAASMQPKSRNKERNQATQGRDGSTARRHHTGLNPDSPHLVLEHDRRFLDLVSPLLAEISPSWPTLAY